jgi:hypothetical protein
MNEKCKSTSPGAIEVKNQPDTINIEEKLDLTSRLGKGEQIFDITCMP